MLVPVQTSGKKPPLFLVHGMHGVMMLGQTFARVLGEDQPIYAIHADGIDGRRPVINDLPKMVMTYVNEIHRTRPIGQVLIGASCLGTMAAIEIARELQQKGRELGPVILLDPPPLPPGYRQQKHPIDPSQPQLARQLYKQVQDTLLGYAARPDNTVPFDCSDPHQVHLATLAGVGSLIALTRHVPTPFSGHTVLILSAEHAPGFFHPEMPWSKLIAQPLAVHVLPYVHRELLGAGRQRVARAVKFMLEKTAVRDAAPEHKLEPAGLLGRVIRLRASAPSPISAMFAAIRAASAR